MLPFLIIRVYIHVNTMHGDDCALENGHVNQFDNPVLATTDMLL